MAAPVASSDDTVRHSQLVENVVEADVLEGMTRDEVRAKIGAGDPCSRHPRCAENEFEEDDWFYTVGEMGESDAAQAPILIVGFDRFGKVHRTWNLRTH
jgi:outer membrane protein assembly factor BamE (lipoprotein component of BamABCDE complex)